MSGNPLLSIIIAAHNSEQTIAATFHSLLNALGSSITQSEIIIINDDSDDSTEEKINIVASQYPQIAVFKVNYRNVGQVRQHGISLAKGEYITMLDSDDIMKAGSLPSIFEFLSEVKPDMLLTRLHEIRDLNKIDHHWSGLQPKKLSQDEAITRFLIHKDLQAYLCGQFIRRDIYLSHKIPPMTCYEDFYIFPSMLLDAQEIYFQYDSPYYYVKHSGSLSTTPDQNKINNLITCTQKMENELPTKFNHLILCHWLDIYLKHSVLLKEDKQKNIVLKHVLMTHSLRFFMNFKVRFSYKRKALSTLWKN